MIILAIDPGPEQSAWLFFAQPSGILSAGIDKNETILKELPHWSGDHLVIEKVESFGMPVGREVFETVFWSGRFAQRWDREWSRIGRIAIKNHLCHSSRAKDSNIRRALIDRFGPPGTKKAPGITYGISRDLWSALAVAVTFSDTYNSKGES